MLYYFYVVKARCKKVFVQIILFIVQIAFSRAEFGSVFPLGFSFALARIFFGSHLLIVTLEYAIANIFLWSEFYLLLSACFEIIIMSLYYFFKETIQVKNKKLMLILFLILSSMVKLYLVLTSQMTLLNYLVELGLKLIFLAFIIKLYSVFQSKFIFLKCSTFDYLLFSVFGVLLIWGLLQYEFILNSIGICLFLTALLLCCRFLPTDKFLIFAISTALCFGFIYSSSKIIVLSSLGIILLVAISRAYKYLYLPIVMLGMYLMFYFSDLLTLGNIINASSAILFTIFVPQRLVNKLSHFFEEKNLDIIKENLWYESQREIKNNLFLMSKTLKKMQEDFKFLIVGKIDRKYASEELAKDVIYNCCETCDRKILCANSFIDKQRVLSEFIHYAISKGSFYVDELSIGFKTYCDKTNIISQKIAELSKQYLSFETSVKTEDQSKLMISDELGNFAKLFQNFAKNIDKSPKINKNLSLFAKEMITNNMIEVIDVGVFETEKGIEKIDIVAQNEIVLRRELSETVARIIRQKVQVKQIKHLNYSGVSLVSFVMANSLRIEFAVSTRSKESVNGDNTLITKIDDYRFFVALADGMGHGKLAGKTSKMILELIQNMFLVGINLEVIIESVNKLLIPVGLDNFSTLDIAVVDLRNSKCTFIKLGSSVSLIKHKQNTELVSGSSLPVGIVQNLKPSIETYSIRDGDVIVLASDGVVDGFESLEMYKVFINDFKVDNLQGFSDNVLFEVANKNNAHKDDMSIIALKLLKNSNK